jgi:glycosyltransferase involved in cell wall biosynthesis
MRILHVVPSYIPAWRYGGPIKSVHGLCKGLAKIGHEVHVFTTNVDGPQRLDVPLGVPVDMEGVRVTYFASDRMRRLYWSPDMLRALHREVPRFDVLHLHSIYLWPTTAAARVARKYDVPYVLAPRGMLVGELIRRRSRWLKTAWIELFERRNLAGAAAVHFTSRLEEEEATKLGFTFNASCVVPNGVDDDEIRDGLNKYDLPPGFPFKDQRFVLFIGRINWKKGLDRLIRALPFVPDCRLVIAGNDEEQYQPALEALAKQVGVHERIAFVGPVYGLDKRAILGRATVLVLPSYSENFGNVVLEAMATGCPVVVTPEVGAADLVLEAGAGVVLDGSPEKLGRGIADLIADPERCRTMGQRGRDAVVAKYTWEAIAQRMEAVYRTALKGRTCSPYRVPGNL